MECAVFSSVVKFFERHHRGTFQDITRYVQDTCKCDEAKEHIEAALDNGMELGLIEPIGRGSVKLNTNTFQFFEFRRCKTKPMPKQKTIRSRVSFSRRSSRIKRGRVRRRSGRKARKSRSRRRSNTRLSQRRKMRGRSRRRSHSKRPVNKWCLKFDGIREMANTLKSSDVVDFTCQPLLPRVEKTFNDQDTDAEGSNRE